ncbi:hypothetical protein AgCh_037368 [Apium graveolens]
MSFERILFCATGGNVYLKQAVVGHPVIDPVIDPVSGEKKADKRKKIHAFKRQNAWQQFQTTKGRAKKQEESQRDVLTIPELEFSAMLSKKSIDSRVVVCTACGGKGHTSEKCWTVIGYPSWHLKHKKPFLKNNNLQNKKIGNRVNNPRMANHVVQGTSEIHTDSDIVFSPQQLEQILKLIPGEAL